MTIPAIPEIRLGRLTFVAEVLSVSPPEGLPADLLDADSAPAKAVLTFCKENGASLDFIYLGVHLLGRWGHSGSLYRPRHFAPHWTPSKAISSPAMAA